MNNPYQIHQPHKIVSVTLNGSGELEVVRQYPSNTMFACYPPRQAPDRVVKEIYKCGPNGIVLDKTIEGKHIPSSVVPERIEF